MEYSSQECLWEAVRQPISSSGCDPLFSFYRNRERVRISILALMEHIDTECWVLRGAGSRDSVRRGDGWSVVRGRRLGTWSLRCCVYVQVPVRSFEIHITRLPFWLHSPVDVWVVEVGLSGWSWR